MTGQRALAETSYFAVAFDCGVACALSVARNRRKIGRPGSTTPAVAASKLLWNGQGRTIGVITATFDPPLFIAPHETNSLLAWN